MDGVYSDRSSRCRGRAGGFLAVGTLALCVAPVEGQRLLTLTPRATQPATVAAQDLGPEVAPVAVQVDLELLRSEPVRLELPTPDGRLLSAELTVLEDRGGGDLMWSGGLPGAGFDSVVLTVEGGRLVGWFGEPGGVRYRISARPDGGGQMASSFGLPGREPEAFCPVGSDFDRLPPRVALPPGARAVDLPARVGAAQSHERLDILVVYTPRAALYWGGPGGARATIRSAADYLNMVLRNGGIGVNANIVHMAEVSSLDRVGRDGTGLYGSSIISQLRFDGEAHRLRREHGADLVHLFTGESPWVLGGACGQHYLLARGDSAEDFSEYAYGWTSAACADEGPIFAHEIGHGLGAHHDPANGGSPQFAFRPYAFGHGNHDHVPNAGTIMSYTGQGEPYLSSVRIRPHGRVIGISNERENERALRESIHIGVRYGDSVSPLPPGAPAAPTALRVVMEDDVSARLVWLDNAPDADGYEVTFWRSDQVGDPDIRRFEERSTVVVDLPEADPGTRYFFFVRAVSGESTYSARSSTVTLVTPGAEPAAPSELAWQSVAVEEPIRMGTNAARVSWVDNSGDEYYFEVQLLDRFGSLARRKFVASGSTSTLISRLAPGATYLVRVKSVGPGGISVDREVLRLESPPAPGPRAVSNLTATATGATSVRLTWADNSSGELGFRVVALVSGWFALFEAEANSETIEIEGLARGGSYYFFVFPYDDAGLGGRSLVGLGLGGTGRGPAAPTRLAWGMEGGRARLTWKDNSSGENGFEIQSRPEYETQDTTVVGGGRWERLALVPAGARSFELPRSEAVDYRVFAYSDAGYSRASNTVRGMPAPSGEPPEEDGGLMVVPSGETSVELIWTGRWTRPARGTLVIEARNPASGWTEVGRSEATAGGTVIAGLEPETPYTFRLRSGAADHSPEASATTGAFQGACRKGADYLCLRDGRFEVRADWSRPDVLEEFGAGTAVPVAISDESGLFWFFESENIELVVKVLDGTAMNGSYWVFFGALSDVEYWITVRDARTGERRTYHNPPKDVCGQKDLLAFSDMTAATGPSPAADAGAGRPGFDLLRMNVASLDPGGSEFASDGSGRCEASDERLCLLDDRFAVEVDFIDPNVDADVPRAGSVIPSLTTGKTGFYWFFSPSNVELAVKMLDGRGVNGRFWFLYGGLSDVEYTVTVTDTVTDSVATYRNEPGSICGEIDIDAF